jgi:hypothetical protein
MNNRLVSFFTLVYFPTKLRIVSEDVIEMGAITSLVHAKAAKVFTPPGISHFSAKAAKIYVLTMEQVFFAAFALSFAAFA